MVGCRHGSKNTLDRNYLYLAEANGATVRADRQVVDVIPRAGGGYEVVSERSGSWGRARRHSLTAEQVIFSAGVLGTVKLLAQLRETGAELFALHVGERLVDYHDFDWCFVEISLFEYLQGAPT